MEIFVSQQEWDLFVKCVGVERSGL